MSGPPTAGFAMTAVLLLLRAFTRMSNPAALPKVGNASLVDGQPRMLAIGIKKINRD